jgi:hypothetical protein
VASEVSNRSRTDAELNCAVSGRISTGVPGIRGWSSRRMASAIGAVGALTRTCSVLKFCAMTWT